jgi:pimeloyl-ACP methyl ester carboxylesterase
LIQKRAELAKLLWKLWSPTWAFDEPTFNRTAASFENPDFVEVVIHSYRHRAGNAAGDPRYAQIESRLATLPKISVPTIVIHGKTDGVNPPENSAGHHKNFTGYYERLLFNNVGHNPPQEAPRAFAEAVLKLCARTAAPA